MPVMDRRYNPAITRMPVRGRRHNEAQRYDTPSFRSADSTIFAEILPAS
jgi:hypothetical protein